MNRWFGVGRVKHTPSFTHADKPKPILRLSIVTNDVRDDGGDDVQWHNVVLRGDLAVVWSGRVSKNDVVGVVCEVRYYSSERGGMKRIITEMAVKEIRLITRAIDSASMVDDSIPF